MSNKNKLYTIFGVLLILFFVLMTIQLIDMCFYLSFGDEYKYWMEITNVNYGTFMRTEHNTMYLIDVVITIINIILLTIDILAIILTSIAIGSD